MTSCLNNVSRESSGVHKSSTPSTLSPPSVKASADSVCKISFAVLVSLMPRNPLRESPLIATAKVTTAQVAPSAEDDLVMLEFSFSNLLLSETANVLNSRSALDLQDILFSFAFRCRDVPVAE